MTTNQLLFEIMTGKITKGFKTVKKSIKSKIKTVLQKSVSKQGKLSTKLDQLFFNVSCETLANSLLGKVLVRKLEDGMILKGRIVETECYPGGEDKASISFNGRQTLANKPVYMEAGTTFVYLTYGMYHCFNISSTEPGGAVLIRALEPIVGIDKMFELRMAKRKANSTPIKFEELCNGPSKLCQAMDINKHSLNAVDICTNETFWVENDKGSKSDKLNIIETSRIGIDSAGPEWAGKPYRYYIFGNAHVSRRDIKKEKDMHTV